MEADADNPPIPLAAPQAAPDARGRPPADLRISVMDR